MKIMFVQHDATLMGGVSQVTLQLSRGLTQSGIQSVAVLPEEGELREALETQGTKTFVVPCEVFPGSTQEAGWRYLKDVEKRIESYQEIIGKEDVDLVHTNTIFVLEGAIAALRTGKPHVWHIHNNLQLDSVPAFVRALAVGNGARAQLFDWLSDCLVAVSRDTAESLQPANKCKVRVIHNGLDVDSFDSRGRQGFHNDIRADLKLSPDALVVGTVGRITRQKNIRLLLESARLVIEKVPQAHFVIIGPPDDAPYAASLVQWVGEHDLSAHIHFPGRRDDVASLYAQLDLFVLSSDWEGLPTVALEAMAARKAIVATRCGGTEEVVAQNETGVLVEKGDSASMTDAIRRLLQDSDLRTRLGNGGRERIVGSFSSDVFTRQFVGLYRELLEKRDGRQRPHKLLAVDAIVNLAAHSAASSLAQKDLERRVAELEAFLDRMQATFAYRATKFSYKTLRKCFFRT